MPDNTVTIGLLLRPEMGYGRSIGEGIGAWFHRRADVRLQLIPFAAAEARAMVAHQRPAGVIGQLYPHLYAALADLQVPLVTVSAPAAAPGAVCVTMDAFGIGQVAAEHLLAQGYTHFATFTNDRALRSSERMAGFRQTVAEAAERHPQTIAAAVAPYIQHGGAEPLPDWLAALPKPVGVFAYSDQFAVSLVAACNRYGWRIPQDIGVIAAGNDVFLCELTQPGVSSVRFATREIGFRAAARLWAILQGDFSNAEPELLAPLGIAGRASSQYVPVADDRLSRALIYMRKHRAEPLTVGDIARLVGVNRRWLERHCKLRLGRSPAAELRRLRQERARDLLCSTALPLAEIAAASGFANASQLCAVFRREQAQTPTAYRRRATGAEP